MNIFQPWSNIQFILILIIMNGCGFFKHEEKEPEICLQNINITLDADANNDTATAIDLVIVYKSDLLKALMKIPATHYFASAEQIRRDYPQMIDVWHWELAPTQTLMNYPITLRDDPAVGALIFTYYNTPGEHRIRLGTYDNITVRLMKDDFCILEQGCDTSRQSSNSLNQSTLEQKKIDAIEGTFQHDADNRS